MKDRHLEALVAALHATGEALREDKVEEVLKQLAGAVLLPLLQRYLPAVRETPRLDQFLEVLLCMLSADGAACGMLLDSPAVRREVDVALARCGTEASRGLWARAEVVRAGGAAPLRSVVERRAREAAAAAAATREELPDPGQGDLLPSMEELLRPPRGLPRNRDGAWREEETEAYRRTHYALLREELLAPMREAIASFLDERGVCPPEARGVVNRSGGSSYVAYPDTRVTEFALSKSKTPMLRVKFGLSSGRHVDFSLGSHLVYGSLVILFEVGGDGRPVPGSAVYATVEDFCNNMLYYAMLCYTMQYNTILNTLLYYNTVEDFDLHTVQNRRVVGVSPLHEDWSRLSTSKGYVMIESPGYFHAIRPVLGWLRDPARLQALRLRRELLSGQRDGHLPPDRGDVEQHAAGGAVRRPPLEYLAGVRVDLSCLYKRNLARSLLWKACDPLAAWPDAADLELDDSQQEAMRHILSSRVPLVQGPPGTGKSYIGVKAVQIARQALDHKQYTEPIVLICLTNHALDQFLEDLLDHFPELIRFGGRSKSEDPRLAACQVTNHLRSGKDAYNERMQRQQALEWRVAQLEKYRCLLRDTRWHAALLLSAVPPEVLRAMLEAIGLEALEAGIFLPPPGKQTVLPDPVGFVTWVLGQWAGGQPLEQVILYTLYVLFVLIIMSTLILVIMFMLMLITLTTPILIMLIMRCSARRRSASPRGCSPGPPRRATPSRPWLWTPIVEYECISYNIL